MRHPRWVLLLVGLLALPAAGREASTRFTVSAVVPARASLQIIGQPGRLIVTHEDIARGYKDVDAVYRVRANDPKGYLLQLSPRLGLTRQVEVSGLEQPILLRQQSIAVHRPASGVARDLELRFRFALAAEAVPGTHEWPVHLAVVPL